MPGTPPGPTPKTSARRTPRRRPLPPLHRQKDQPDQVLRPQARRRPRPHLGPHRTAKAAEATAIDNKARRGKLVARLYDEVEAVLTAIEDGRAGNGWQTILKGAYGAKVGDTLTFIPSRDRRDVAEVLSRHLLSATKMDAIDATGGVKRERSLPASSARLSASPAPSGRDPLPQAAPLQPRSVRPRQRVGRRRPLREDHRFTAPLDDSPCRPAHGRGARHVRAHPRRGVAQRHRSPAGPVADLRRGQHRRRQLPAGCPRSPATPGTRRPKRTSRSRPPTTPSTPAGTPSPPPSHCGAGTSPTRRWPRPSWPRGHRAATGSAARTRRRLRCRAA